jgi:hypothetical protein
MANTSSVAVRNTATQPNGDFTTRAPRTGISSIEPTFSQLARLIRRPPHA